MKPLVAVDRLFEVARQLDDRAGGSSVAQADEARGQQAVAGAIRNGVEQAKVTNGSGDDVAVLAVEHELDAEIVEERMTRLARRRSHANTAHPRELHEQASHAAARTVHEHRVA